jgi:hypothetical protein
MQHIQMPESGRQLWLPPADDNSNPDRGREADCTPSMASPSSLSRAGEIEIAGRRYVTPRRLSSVLGVTARTLARWNARGLGPPKITVGKTVLFDLEKVPEWLASRETHPVRNPRDR